MGVYIPPLAAMNVNYRYYGFERFVEESSRSGYAWIELWTGPMHIHLDDDGFDELGPVRSLLANANLRVVSICPEQNNPKPWNVASRDEGARRRTERYFKHAIDMACVLDARKVTMTAGWAFYDEAAEIAWMRSVSMLSHLARYAEQRDVCLALEALQPLESRLVNSAADIRRLLEDVNSDALCACIDFGAMEVAGDTIDGYYEALPDRIRHVHFVDADDNATHLAWGEGHRSMRDDLVALVKHGYMGVCTVETCDARYRDDPFTPDRHAMEMYREILETKL